jgi:hypothetical protein
VNLTHILDPLSLMLSTVKTLLRLRDISQDRIAIWQLVPSDTELSFITWASNPANWSESHDTRFSEDVAAWKAKRDVNCFVIGVASDSTLKHRTLRHLNLVFIPTSPLKANHIFFVGHRHTNMASDAWIQSITEIGAEKDPLRIGEDLEEMNNALNGGLLETTGEP